MNSIEIQRRLKLFFEDPEFGWLTNISSKGCLELLKQGSEVWNYWRTTYPAIKSAHGEYDNFVNFESVDFEQLGRVDFSGFNFGDGACFDNTKLGSHTNFIGSVFGNDASFQNAILVGARFTGARFGRSATFRRARFADSAAEFSGAIFLDFASFLQSNFEEHAYFTGASFGNGADFVETVFAKSAIFVGTDWEGLKRSYPTIAVDWGGNEQYAKEYGLSPEEFIFINFAGATFKQGVYFSNRAFIGGMSFGTTSLGTTPDVIVQGKIDFYEKWLPEDKAREWRPVRFGLAPVFHGCTIHPNISFDRAVFPKATGDEQAILAYITLKSAFAKNQNTRYEQKFFRLEMAEETLYKQTKNRWLYKLYSWFSDYGFSIKRPLLWLFAVLLICYPLYGWIANLPIWQPFVENSTFSWGLVNHTIISLLPFPLLDKGEMGVIKTFSDGQRVLWTVVAIIQKITSALLLFLAGLALRNLFKMK